ncbi:putative glucosaminidase domain-containing protein [Bacillus phage vB_BspH_Mawwa]|nr:putative glucosaminidase domain-containing protein [Bacillus phage vB_BspH_Mawwa]
MANVEKYIFDVDANTRNAVKKLQQINKLMDQIDNIRSRGVDNYFTTTQKDMDKNMRSMSQLSKLYRSLNQDLTGLQRKMRDMADSTVIPKGATNEQKRQIQDLKRRMDEQSRAAIAQQKALQSEYTKTLAKFRELSSFQQTASKSFKHVFNSNDIYNLPTGAQNFNRAKSIISAMSNEADGASSKLNDVISKIREVNKLDRRSESLSRRASASGYMSYQQYSNFIKDYNTSRTRYAAEKEANTNAMASLGQERSSLKQKISDIETNPNASQRDRDMKIAMQQTVASIDKEMETRMELNRTLERTINNMRKYNDELAKNGGVEVKPERGTTRGMLYERAPAIGLAVTAAAAAVAGGLYNQGAQLNRSMRGDIISMGQRTGAENWRRDIRDNALEAGLKDQLGFTGQEMLAFQGNYLDNAGYKGMGDLNAAMTNQAVFSRTTGIDSDTTRQFFDSAFSTGAVSGSQVKDVQNAFVGAIKQSGMEGREKDQLKALQGILQSTSQGRSMSNEEVMNVMGMQSVLASSGVRSLTGEKGGQLLTDLNQGIRQGFNNPAVRMVFGQGTEYQGLAGRFALREKMDKGIADVDNVRKIARWARNEGGSSEAAQNEAFATFVQSALGVDITAEQARGLMDLDRQEKLTEETIKKYVETDKATGAKESQDKLAKYQGSSEAIDNQSDATTEKQATQLYDYGEKLRELNNAMGSLSPVTYTATAALAALAASATGAAASFLGGSLLRGRVSDRFPGGGGPQGGGGGRIGGFLTTTRTAVGGLFDPNVRRGGLPNTGPSGGGGPLNRFMGGTSFAAAEAGTAAGTAAGGGKIMQGLGKVGSFASKAALPLSIATSIGAIALAPEDKKGEAVGSAAGGIGGGMAGAALGASIGSVVPVVGTAIGGIAGGIIGSVGGSGIGGWLGGLFDPKKAEAAELPEEKQKAEPMNSQLDKQVDRENTNTKDRAENQRTDNLALERQNIKEYDSLLTRASRLLNQARMQGGIFGSLTGSAGGGGSAISGSSGSLKILPEGKKWANPSDLTNSDLGYTDGKLTAEDLNKWIDSKAPKNSLMRGMGEAFFKAGQESGLDPRYLIAHAAQETGWGTSNILKSKNNWFGIGAFDNSPFSSAKSFEGREKGIIEGAKWISENYYNKGNTTLSKMKQAGYATDPQWANRISSIMKGAPSGTGTMKVESTINVNVTGNDVSSKVTNSAEMKKMANDIQNRIYGMQYFAQETKRV